MIAGVRRSGLVSLGCALLLLSATGVAARAQQIDDPFSDKNQRTDNPLAAGSKADTKVSPKPARNDPVAKGSWRQVNKTQIDDLIDLKFTIEPAQVRRGQTVKLTITGVPKPGYHTYPFIKPSDNPSQSVSQIVFGDAKWLKPLPPVTESEPEPKNEPGSGLLFEYAREFTVSQDILILPEAEPGLKSLPFTLRMQVCDENRCTPGDAEFEITVDINSGPPVALTPELDERSVQKFDAAAAIESEQKGIWTFLLNAIGWGAISLLTPCVFPMIPITVSFFLKQAHHGRARTLAMASVYSGTIVVALTLGGVLLIKILQPFSQHWITNYALGILFIIFAMSLFGMFELRLPTALLNFTSAQEGRGGLAGTMFMALTFTTISFTCVAPFYGSFIALASSAQSVGAWLTLVLGAFVYSVTFASPFFLLAVFPSLLRSLPKSGSWMNTVKVVMGFLEIAAALKFLRAGELSLTGDPAFLTYDLALGMYVAIALLCGLYLLNVYRLPHDHEPVVHLGVPRLMFSLLFLSFGFYLMPGLFKQSSGEQQKPTGTLFAWVNSFLLSDPSGGGWIGNLEKGLELARTQKKLVFIDFTGITCTNCRYNEESVFTRPEIKQLLEQYTRVQLYTDTVPPRYQPTTSAAENFALQKTTFGTVQLPLYAVLKPSGAGKFDVVGSYPEGKINNLTAFGEFLQKPLGINSDGVLAAATQK
ncbi:MAG TPA: cytochrome c biogenesis protein CcdA [Gemmataceae bacterium]|nr:cytochrome c biogenesis protein CcdA [Gemmataceae bacterium]